MRMKQIHRRILGGCLTCLLCFTGSIHAFAAETATPANADERTEILPDLESEAPGTLDSGTTEASEEASLVLVTEIQNEGELLSLPAFTLPLRTTPSDDDLEEIYQLAFSIKPFAPLYQQVKKSGRKHFLSHGIFRPLTRPLRANIPQQVGLNCRRGMPLVKLYCRSFRFPSGWKKCRLLSLPP